MPPAAGPQTVSRMYTGALLGSRGSACMRQEDGVGARRAWVGTAARLFLQARHRLARVPCCLCCMQALGPTRTCWTPLWCRATSSSCRGSFPRPATTHTRARRGRRAAHRPRGRAPSPPRHPATMPAGRAGWLQVRARMGGDGPGTSGACALQQATQGCPSDRRGEGQASCSRASCDGRPLPLPAAAAAAAV